VSSTDQLDTQAGTAADLMCIKAQAARGELTFQHTIKWRDRMAARSKTPNPLLPWWIGLAIILVAVIYVGYQFATLECGAGTAGFLAFIVLGVVPAVYLSLMYLTLKSQAERERM
jgi:hypothetical protein